MPSSPACAPATLTRRRGVSAAFADPRLAAAQARPVWLPQTDTDALCLTANAISAPATTAPGLLVAALTNVKHILIDTLGRQHVVLQRGTTHMHLVASGHAVAIAPVILGLRIERSEEIGATAQRLARLERLSSALPDVDSPPWTAETLRLRDALIALDGYCAGASLREIATVIYGWRRIEEDWPGKGLRHRVRRARQRGLALRDGGYRDLLG